MLVPGCFGFVWCGWVVGVVGWVVVEVDGVGCVWCEWVVVFGFGGCAGAGFGHWLFSVSCGRQV